MVSIESFLEGTWIREKPIILVAPISKIAELENRSFSANPLLYGVNVAVMNRSGVSLMLLQRALLDASTQSNRILPIFAEN